MSSCRRRRLIATVGLLWRLRRLRRRRLISAILLLWGSSCWWLMAVLVGWRLRAVLLRERLLIESGR